MTRYDTGDVVRSTRGTGVVMAVLDDGLILRVLTVDDAGQVVIDRWVAARCQRVGFEGAARALLARLAPA